MCKFVRSCFVRFAWAIWMLLRYSKKTPDAPRCTKPISPVVLPIGFRPYAEASSRFQTDGPYLLGQQLLAKASQQCQPRWLSIHNCLFPTAKQLASPQPQPKKTADDQPLGHHGALTWPRRSWWLDQTTRCPPGWTCRHDLSSASVTWLVVYPSEKYELGW